MLVFTNTTNGGSSLYDKIDKDFVVVGSVKTQPVGSRLEVNFYVNRDYFERLEQDKKDSQLNVLVVESLIDIFSNPAVSPENLKVATGKLHNQLINSTPIFSFKTK